MHNIDRLTPEQQDLAALLFTLTTGWTLTYMIEVKLNDPISNMLNGGNDGLCMHGGNGSRCYTKHMDDPDWIVIHKDDVPEWDISKMASRAANRLDAYRETYPEAG